MPRAVQRPAARRDFIIHYVYLAENGSLDLAQRFRQAVEAAYNELAEMPGMGAPAKVAPANARSSSYLADPRIRGVSNRLQTTSWRRRNRTDHPRQTGLSADSPLELGVTYARTTLDFERSRPAKDCSMKSRTPLRSLPTSSTRNRRMR